MVGDVTLEQSALLDDISLWIITALRIITSFCIIPGVYISMDHYIQVIVLFDSRHLGFAELLVIL